MDYKNIYQHTCQVVFTSHHYFSGIRNMQLVQAHPEPNLSWAAQHVSFLRPPELSLIALKCTLHLFLLYIYISFYLWQRNLLFGVKTSESVVFWQVKVSIETVSDTKAQWSLRGHTRGRHKVTQYLNTDVVMEVAHAVQPVDVFQFNFVVLWIPTLQTPPGSVRRGDTFLISKCCQKSWHFRNSITTLCLVTSLH